MRAVRPVAVLAAMLICGTSTAAAQGRRGSSGTGSHAGTTRGNLGNPVGGTGVDLNGSLRGTITSLPRPNLGQDAAGATAGSFDGTSSAAGMPADPLADRAADRAVDRLIEGLPLVAKQRRYERGCAGSC